jgi:hypothetical protein
MDKVFHERPRSSSAFKCEPKGYFKELDKAWKTQEFELPCFESNSPVRRYGWDHKESNNLISPIKRFLSSKVGEKWDGVWSEICTSLTFADVKRTVRQYVEGMVCLQTMMIDEVPHNSDGRCIYNKFYVHPTTGLLCESKTKKYSHNRRYIANYVAGKDAWHQFHLIDDFWYEITLERFPDDCVHLGWHNDYKDVLMHNRIGVSLADCVRRYGCYGYAVSKLQVNKRDIKKFKLWETELGIFHLQNKTA